MHKYIVETEDKTYKDLSFDESYELFTKLHSEGIRVICYPEPTEYIPT